MEAKTLRILEANTYSVTAAQLPAGQILTIPVAVNIPSAWAVHGTVVLRAHAFSVGSGTGTPPSVQTITYGSAPTDEDPNTLYRGSPVINTGVKIFGAAAFTPAVLFDTNSFAPGNLAGFLDVLLLLTQWGTTAGALSVKVSIDLVLRA